MQSIKAIQATQLTESEIMIYIMVSNGASYRYLGKVLGVSNNTVRNMYERASIKAEVMAEAGLFQSKVKPAKPVDNH